MVIVTVLMLKGKVKQRPCTIMAYGTKSKMDPLRIINAQPQTSQMNVKIPQSKMKTQKLI